MATKLLVNVPSKVKKGMYMCIHAPYHLKKKILTADIVVTMKLSKLAKFMLETVLQ